MLTNFKFNIPELDTEAMEKCQIRLDNLTKPLNSLYYFELIAKKIAGLTSNPKPAKINKMIVVLSENSEISIATKVIAEHVNAQTMLLNFDNIIANMSFNSSDDYIKTGLELATNNKFKTFDVIGLGQISSKIVTSANEFINLYLQQCIATKGYPPSVREIGEAVGLRSSSTVHRYLAELENDGFIIKDPSKPRAITLVSVDDDTNVIAKDIKTIALVGEVAAGSPILAVENIEETFAFSSSLIKGSDSFMLKVKGDSMINCGIFDGDYVIVKKQNTANNNDIVVALIDNEETTLKRFFKEKNTIRLQPENDFMEPIYTDNVSILGKVVSLFRYNI